MRKIILNNILFLFFIFPTILFSQNKITGQIFDAENNPIEFATINLQTQNNTLVKTEFSDEYGKFEIEEKTGIYFLEISYLGNSLYTKNINLTENIDLGIITVENSIQLEGIVITKDKKLIEKKIDRLVFNVENSVIATGGDVLDILKITPRIKVQNDQISMIGKSGMSVMIDDRMTYLSGSDLANYLRTLKSDEIKSIEVITNPPAKYSAEGNSGIINVVTKKQRQDAWNATIRSVYQQATYATGLGGAGFNFKKNKITLSSNLNYTNGSNAPIENNTIDYSNITWKEQNKRRDFSKSVSARLGLDYKISNKISTGFIYNYSHNTPEIRDNVTTTLFSPETNFVDSLIITKAKNERKRISNNLNYHFIYDIDTLGRKLSFDFDFFNFKLNSNRVFQTNNYYNDSTPIENSYSSADNKGNQKISNYSFNLDMEHPFDWANLNYGGRLSYINTDNNFEYYDLTSGVPIFDTSQSNRFKYEENTQAVYFSAQKEISEKWEAKIGLRLENTQLKGNSVTLNQENESKYTKLFPTAYLSFVPNDNHSFSLNYNRRINRPNYSLLNPFLWITSPYSYSEGNPYLQPSFSNNVEFEYIFKENYISTLYFSHTDDGFEQTAILDAETNVQQIIPLNFLINRTFGFNQTIILKPLKWLNINFFGDVYYSSADSKIPVTLDYLKGWNGFFSISNDLILNKEKTFMLNLSYNYTTKGVDNLDYNTSHNQLNASLRALFLEKKLVISLYANDIFSSNRPIYTTYSNNIKNSFRNYYDERFFRLSAVYNFGKSFKRNNREIKNSDEINRTN
ncbi:outer membrane beta-barrel family protein [Empedobacter falsenii]|uniref:outer membrane beta-barrel family protein n=1 Tax=Empedobacter falsenii TaxID=343874 RepID=UPI001C563537|nr:outer membrane beta-barrel family protein [Empedobacter falsenii]MBW1619375.1 TonB-dependent receptor [Empedobacter falsenii]